MRIKLYSELFKQIVEAHKAGVTFFSGIIQNVNLESVNYPIFLLEPIIPDPNYTGRYTDYGINFTVLDILPQSATGDDSINILNKTGNIVSDVLYTFLMTAGQDKKEYTIDGEPVTFDFDMVSKSPLTPQEAVGASNVFGYSASLIIRDVGSIDACCIEQSFD